MTGLSIDVIELLSAEHTFIGFTPCRDKEMKEYEITGVAY